MTEDVLCLNYSGLAHCSHIVWYLPAALWVPELETLLPKIEGTFSFKSKHYFRYFS